MTATTPQKSNGGPAAATFSYAQAAKGRSPSVPDTAAEVEKPLAKRTSSEGHISSGEFIKPRSESDMTSPEKTETNKSSVPSSPDFGTASTSTLPKEDDPFSSQNGSSDSTWDKQSEVSQNGSKGTQKADADKHTDEALSWSDDAPPPLVLKDAPPPTINYWQQRKEAQEAKTRANRHASAQTSKVADASTQAPSVPKSLGETNQRKPKLNHGNQEANHLPVNTKDGTKAGDGKVRNVNDAKPPARSGRTVEPQKSNAAVAAPLPPPGDAMSWPTPDSAQDEEKKKAQERAGKADKDKGNAPAPKPHGKEKWTAIPFVPSAVFNTPMPQSRRGGGGRPNRGGRDGGTGRGGNLGSPVNDTDRQGVHGGLANQPTASVNDRGRPDFNPSKISSNGAKAKRSASAGPATVREQRKVGDVSLPEKRKDQDIHGGKRNIQQNPATGEAGGASAITQLDKEVLVSSAYTIPASVAGQRPVTATAPVDSEPGDKRQSGPFDDYTHPRPTMPERRGEGPRPFDCSRDFFGPAPQRERSDGRPERGRGSYRGRGNANHGFANPSYINGNSFANGHTAQHQPQMMPPTKSHSNHERHPSQTSSSQSQPQPRNLRSNSRSQSIAHPAQYGRYSSGPYSGAPHLGNIQTEIANVYGYQPGNQGPMSAVPFSPYADQASLYGMVSMQMEYYFSLDNLCKDLFLRKHMDSQGFVFLSVLANFNRIRQLTEDMDLIRLVCLNSANIEIRTGPDGIDRLRKQEGWQQWILGMEERDPSAQNEGPSDLQRPRVSQTPIYAMPYGYEDVSETPASFVPPIHINENGPQNLLNGTASASYQPNEAVPFTNGTIHDTMQTPVSAAVPDYPPTSSPANPGASSHAAAQTHNASSFTDEQVESLMIVVRKPLSNTAPLPPPFHSASSRTFSNGSIDGRTIHDELSKYEERQSRPGVNQAAGHQLNELNMSQRAKSPFSIGSPKRQTNSNASPVFWVKDKEAPLDRLPIGLTHESYNVFRVNALQQREQSVSGVCHHDMDILYQFWSHFLIRNFNPRMYEEFRRTAFEDANQRDSKVGLKNLVQYYDESMLGPKIMSDEIARDYVNLVKSEGSGTERPAFDKLRSAWRNGATNMKNRKKIDNVLDADLKARLER